MRAVVPGVRRPAWLSRAVRSASVFLLCVGIVLVLVQWSDDRWMDQRLAMLTHEQTTEQQVFSLFDWVATRADSFDAGRIASPLQCALARLEHSSPLHLSSRAVLSAGADHIGFCGSLTRSMLVALDRIGIQGRKAILYDRQGMGVHTVVEVWMDGEWRVLDPTYAWYWIRPRDGKIATVADLVSSKPLFASVQASVPEYPLQLYNYDDVRHLRWEKFGLGSWLRGVLVRFKGKEWVDGLQTPSIYERPRLFLGLCCLAIGALGQLFLRRLPHPHR